MLNTIVCLCHIFWILSLVSCVSTLKIPAVAKATSYGKLNTWSSYPMRSGYAFTSYYLTALFWNSAMIYWVLRFYLQGRLPPLDFFFRYGDENTGILGIVKPWFSQSRVSIKAMDVLVPLIVFQIHCLRRFCECLFLHVFSPQSRTSLIVHVAGVAFYMGMGCSIAGDAGVFAQENPILSYQISAHHIIGFIIFIWGSYRQYISHKILAELRTQKDKTDNKSSRGVPMGKPFENRTCPHYFAENMIYFGLVLCSGGRNPSVWFALIWTAMNLSLTAQQTHDWYLSTFPHYHQLKRRPMW